MGGAGERQVGELGASWVGEWYWVRGWEVFGGLSCREISWLGALYRVGQRRGGLSAPCRGRPWGAGGARAARLQRRGVSASERGGEGPRGRFRAVERARDEPARGSRARRRALYAAFPRRARRRESEPEEPPPPPPRLMWLGRG